eukprot:gnl/Chilomastix_cuspidata/5587.p2 GENE.gnl/Chilomastix_cuspidata/5587~~gnl/Chilomastix_cuspidata/5587.p2  ORF type:complete len:917 (+),score=529.17 gnl/Chilomastix_cuspidata/5587:224-2974(+)
MALNPWADPPPLMSLHPAACCSVLAPLLEETEHHIATPSVMKGFLNYFDKNRDIFKNHTTLPSAIETSFTNCLISSVGAKDAKLAATAFRLLGHYVTQWPALFPRFPSGRRDLLRVDLPGKILSHDARTSEAALDLALFLICADKRSLAMRVAPSDISKVPRVLEMISWRQRTLAYRAMVQNQRVFEGIADRVRANTAHGAELRGLLGALETRVRHLETGAKNVSRTITSHGDALHALAPRVGAVEIEVAERAKEISKVELVANGVVQKSTALRVKLSNAEARIREGAAGLAEAEAKIAAISSLHNKSIRDAAKERRAAIDAIVDQTERELSALKASLEGRTQQQASLIQTFTARSIRVEELLQRTQDQTLQAAASIERLDAQVDALKGAGAETLTEARRECGQAVDRVNEASAKLEAEIVDLKDENHDLKSLMSVRTREMDELIMLIGDLTDRVAKLELRRRGRPEDSSASGDEAEPPKTPLSARLRTRSRGTPSVRALGTPFHEFSRQDFPAAPEAPARFAQVALDPAVEQVTRDFIPVQLRDPALYPLRHALFLSEQHSRLESKRVSKFLQGVIAWCSSNEHPNIADTNPASRLQLAPEIKYSLRVIAYDLFTVSRTLVPTLADRPSSGLRTSPTAGPVGRPLPALRPGAHEFYRNITNICVISTALIKAFPRTPSLPVFRAGVALAAQQVYVRGAESALFDRSNWNKDGKGSLLDTPILSSDSDVRAVASLQWLLNVMRLLSRNRENACDLWFGAGADAEVGFLPAAELFDKVFENPPPGRLALALFTWLETSTASKQFAERLIPSDFFAAILGAALRTARASLEKKAPYDYAPNAAALLGVVKRAVEHSQPEAVLRIKDNNFDAELAGIFKDLERGSPLDKAARGVLAQLVCDPECSMTFRRLRVLQLLRE